MPGLSIGKSQAAYLQTLHLNQIGESKGKVEAFKLDEVEEAQSTVALSGGAGVFVRDVRDRAASLAAHRGRTIDPAGAGGPDNFTARAQACADR